MEPSFDDLVTPEKCGEMLGGDKPISTATLANWRSLNRFPDLPWIKMGGLIRYRKVDIESFLKARLTVPNAFE